MNLSDEIRKQIEKNKGLKLAVGEINNHLSIIENLVKKDIMEQVDEAYQRGLEDGKKAFDLLDAERDSEYQRGLNDAWEVAGKIADMWKRIDNDELLAIFGVTEPIGHSTIKNLFGKQTASEAIEKLKLYEEKQKAENEIKVRDEVVWTVDENVVIVVTRVYTVDGFEWCDGVCRDGKVYHILTEHARKTGRRFEIDKILEEMRT